MGSPLNQPPAGDSGGFLWWVRVILLANVLIVILIGVKTNTQSAPTTTLDEVPMQLTKTSLGPIEVNMAWDQAISRGAVEIQEVGCQLAVYSGAFLHGKNNIVVSITLTTPEIETDTGLRVGDEPPSALDRTFSYSVRDGVITYIRAGAPDPSC